MIKELKPSKKRTEEDRSRLMATVGDIIADVRMNGDAALMEYNRRFDGCERTALRISEQEIRDAYDKVSAQEIEDIKKAAANIENFAKAQRANPALCVFCV